MKRDLKFERFYPHPPERVWKALTDPDALAAWYMTNDFKPEVGHKFTFHTDPGPGFDGTLNCEVILVDAPHELIYSFIGGFMKRKTTVRWLLIAQEGGTLLRLEHTGFTGLTDAAVSFIIGSGWGRFLAQLPPLLDRLAQAEITES
ncbi:MAG: SRPBCC domain-containing protein [Anaerolineae bacterium]|nr:SRPBCC domain-containing protein [Anaerolineae bacterium]